MTVEVDGGGADGCRPRGVERASAALAVVLRSTRTAPRLRVLVVVCGQQHRLCAVYVTGVGPVAVGMTREVVKGTTTVGGLDWSAEVTTQRVRSRARPLVFAVSEAPAVAEFQCRCTLACIPAGWWADQALTAGRRVVWTEPDEG